MLADAIEAANWQLRLDLGRDQVKAGQYSPEAFQRQEKQTAAVIDRLRGRWSGNLWYRWSFDRDFKRALQDPIYREQALAEYDRSQVSGTGFFGEYREVILVFGGIAAFLAFGAYLNAKGWKPSKPSTIFQRPQPQPSDTHGSASYALARADIPDQMYVFNGVFFGKSSFPGADHLPLDQQTGAPICSTPENHTLIVARTRTGKGTRVVIPTLLRYVTGSALVIDPKGENAAVTARTRQNPFPGKDFHQTVHIINPWGELAPTFQKLGFTPATYNPLDILDRDDPNAVATAQALAAAICPKGTGKDSFWPESAASLLTAVLLWLTDQPGETKTLGRAREIVTLSRKDFTQQFLTKMAASSAFEGAIRENAAQFIDMAQETYSGVISNLSQHTKFLSDPQVKRATAASSFSMRDLMTKPTTVYLVIPPDRMDTQRTWLRLLITAGMQTYKHRAAGGVVRCMFLIDEFPALGKLDELPRDIATMAGYGVDFTLIIQGMDQLKEVYGDAHTTIINNCAFKWFCNVSDLHSAEYLSKTLGKRTVATTSEGTSSNFNPGGGSSGRSITHGETGRDLLMPDEILNLGRDTAILLAPGEKPHYLRPVDYWQLQEAFIFLKQYYPHLYWEPPLKWDENPLPH